MKKNYTGNKFFWILNIILMIVVIIPKNKRIWIFGAWEGEKYSDNSRYFYEYLIKNNLDKNLKMIWITNNKKVINNLNIKTVYLANSFKGIWYKLRAGVVFYTNGMYDFGRVDLSKGAYKVALWHGMPLKKVFYANNSYEYSSKGIKCLKYIKNYLYNQLERNLTISTSKEMSKNLKECFRIEDDEIIITGQPRNDLLVCEEKIKIGEILSNVKFKYKKEFEKIITYMPTYRANPILSNGLKENIISLVKNNRLKEELKNKNILLIIKLHYLMELEIDNKNENIIFLRDKDIECTQKLLKITDILITDYSSVFIDFILQKNKNLIFYGFDSEEYFENDMGLFYKYEKIFDEIIKTEVELVNKIKEVLNNNQSNTEKINEFFNKESKDFNSFSEKLYEYLLKYLKF